MTTITVATLWCFAIIGLGRRPGRADALFITTFLAMILMAVPCVGSTLFFRPYHNNYVAGALPSVALLAMCRCHLTNGSLRRHEIVPFALVLGLLGGMGNEHTGPAFITCMIGCVYLAHRQRGVPLWMIAGTIGLAIGFVALLLAPGQMQRYGGVGQIGLLATITSRSIGHCALIVVIAPAAVLWLLPWMGLARWCRGADSNRLLRPQTYSVGLALIVALGIGFTLLASPKEVARLYFASAALLCSAGAAWTTARLPQRGAAVIWSVNAIVIVAASIGLLRSTLNIQQYAARAETIFTAAPGTDVTVPSVSHTCWQWSLPDDFRDPGLRQHIARELGLRSISVVSDSGR
jgi:Family of unknown function (DUF6056)